MTVAIAMSCRHRILYTSWKCKACCCTDYGSQELHSTLMLHGCIICCAAIQLHYQFYWYVPLHLPAFNLITISNVFSTASNHEFWKISFSTILQK